MPVLGDSSELSLIIYLYMKPASENGKVGEIHEEFFEESKRKATMKLRTYM